MGVTGLHVDADVAGRVARRRGQADPVVDIVVVLHHHGGAGFYHGQNAVLVVGIVGETFGLVFLLPEIPFPF